MQRDASTCQTTWPLAFLHQEKRAAGEGGQHAPADHVVQQIRLRHRLAHTATGSKTKMQSFTVSAT